MRITFVTSGSCVPIYKNHEVDHYKVGREGDLEPIRLSSNNPAFYAKGYLVHVDKWGRYWIRHPLNSTDCNIC